ncbi:hypothetical protein PCANB_002046 [Pneumocystis canis]|nr:hypothetical protein PCK1_001893 [Pneumocystis canis]KAG5439472.1 hypothetical protein PCANB_002046 [Pneumocystis canis]
MTPSVFIRGFETEKISQNESLKLLTEQRLKRPNSPHLSIYQPQLTWCMSAFNRISGCLISAGLYTFAISYLTLPFFGWNLDSSTIASAFHTWPIQAKILTKFIIAFPFTYHSFNGLRHLYWDTGRGLTLKSVYTTGYMVLGLSTISASALALI